MKYDSGNVTLTNEWKVFKPGFDIYYFSLLSQDGDYDLQLRRDNKWGTIIDGFKEIPLADDYRGVQFRVRAKEGEITLSYYLRGE